jgi:hypothetical protein
MDTNATNKIPIPTLSGTFPERFIGVSTAAVTGTSYLNASSF